MVGRFLLVACAILCATRLSPAYAEQLPQAEGLALRTYIQAVLEGNIGLAAQKYNVDVADAAISVAALAPDPLFTFGYSNYELTRFRLPKGTTAILNYTLESPAKREARTQVAQADKSLAETQLAEYMKVLRVDAVNAFLDSMRSHAIMEQRRATLAVFQQLARNAPDSPRKTGLKPEEQAQLRLELARLKGDFYQAQSDAAVADRNLNFYLGQSTLNKPGIFAQGSLEQPEVSFDESRLLESALEQRPDILSAKKALASAAARSKLAHENRNMDYGLTLGVTHTEAMWSLPDASGVYVDGSYPMSTSLMATVTIPIPLSALHDGDLRGPAAAAVQAEVRLKELQSKARIEVQQALLKYQLALQQIATYREGTKDADLIMQNTLKKFGLGDIGFPDIVYYTRTANEIHFAYIEAQTAAAKALLTVYQVSGDWKF